MRRLMCTLILPRVRHLSAVSSTRGLIRSDKGKYACVNDEVKAAYWRGSACLLRVIRKDGNSELDQCDGRTEAPS